MPSGRLLKTHFARRANFVNHTQLVYLYGERCLNDRIINLRPWYTIYETCTRMLTARYEQASSNNIADTHNPILSL